MRTRTRRALGVLGLLWWLAVPTAAAAAAAPGQGPSPGTTTPTPTPGERLQVLGEQLSREGQANADDTLTWLVAAAGTAVAAGISAAHHRHRAVRPSV